MLKDCGNGDWKDVGPVPGLMPGRAWTSDGKFSGEFSEDNASRELIAESPLNGVESISDAGKPKDDSPLNDGIRLILALAHVEHMRAVTTKQTNAEILALISLKAVFYSPE